MVGASSREWILINQNTLPTHTWVGWGGAGDPPVTGPGEGVVAPGPMEFGEGPGPACVGTLTLCVCIWAMGAAGGVATDVFWQ